MGCINSTDTDPGVRRNIPKAASETARGVADDARSFRSKLGAIKMLTKDPKSRHAFMLYLENSNKAELLICYRDLEEIKLLDEEQAFTRVTALIWRYKSIYEEAKINQPGKPKNVEFIMWDALGKLRTLDSNPVPHVELLKFITIAQNDILSRLILPFEMFLNSKYYKEWQSTQLADEVNVRRQSQQQNRAIQQSAALASIPTMHCSSTVSVGSVRTNTFSISHPNVLIVDDSTVTLKLTALTLEKDGHTVERARNGSEALQLLKSRRYHIVLIDLNMPVMDGYETVRLFREYEKSSVTNLMTNTGAAEEEKSDRLSSLSADSGDSGGNVIGANASTAGRRPSSGRRKGSYNGLSNRDAANQVLGMRYALTPAHYHQLIIGMSTNVDEVTKRKAFAAGMDNFLPKPFTLQKFVETIRQAQRVVHDKTVRASFSPREAQDSVPPTVTPNELFEP